MVGRIMLNIKHNVGATNSQANYRHVQFGIDNGRVDEKWADHGRPGQAVLIFSMAVFDDELFVGICVAGKGQSGRVYRYGGDARLFVEIAILALLVDLI